MDIISHGLWGGLVMGQRRRFWLAALFGMLPDAIAFGPYLAVRAYHGGLKSLFIRPDIYPDWVLALYNSTHSLIIAGLIFYCLCLYREETGLMFLAWPLHIVFDIPTHSADNFPTKFLYPLSDLCYDGVHWHHLPVTLANWAGLILFCLILMARRKSALEVKKP